MPLRWGSGPSDVHSMSGASFQAQDRSLISSTSVVQITSAAITVDYADGTTTLRFVGDK